MSAQGAGTLYAFELVLARVIATTAAASGGFPLGPAGTVTFTAKTIAGYSYIVGYVFSDQAGTLVIEESIDGATFDIQTSLTVSAGVALPFLVVTHGTIARARYVNGGVLQTAFRINAVARL